MNRIEDIIKEHGYTATSLAKKIGTFRQNLFAKLKSPSCPTLVETATALDVPMWQLFASPEEVAGAGDFVALIKDGSEIYHADSWQELEKLVSNRKQWGLYFASVLR